MQTNRPRTKHGRKKSLLRLTAQHPACLGAVLVGVILIALASVLTASWRDENRLRQASFAQLLLLTRQQPDNARAFYYLGRRAIQAHQLQTANEAFLHATSLDPDDEEIWLGRADLLATQGQSEQALTVASLFCRRHSANPRAHLVLSRLWHDAGAARSAYDEALVTIRLKPDTAQAWQIAGEEALITHHLPEAEQALRQAITLAPADWLSRTRLGYTLFREGKGDAAEKACHEAVIIAPGQAVPHLALGTVLLERAQTPVQIEAARQELAQAIQLDPGSTRALLYLGRAYKRQGEMKQAKQAIEAARQREPNDVETHYELARVYQALGESENARRELALHRDLSTYKREKQTLQQHYAGSHDPTLGLQLARFLAARGEFADAKRVCRSILATAPRFLPAQTELAALNGVSLHPTSSQGRKQ